MEDIESEIRDSLLLLPVVGREDEEEASRKDITCGVVFEEMKRVSWLAAPMIAVILCQYLLQLISMTIVGHLGKLALSSISIATSFCGVTGFSVLMGMSGALETLSGQAYGAKLYHKVGVQTYTGIFCLTITCLPLCLIWINVEKLLIFIGQDPLISHEAGKYALCLIPGLFASAALQPLIRYFQTQSLISPMFISSLAVLCFHIPLCWVLVFKTQLRSLGGAFAISISSWLNVLFLGLFMKYSPACSETRVWMSKEVFQGIGEFFWFAIPSAAMTCLEWWSFELLILLSGLLPNPQLETSVLSVCLQTLATLSTIPYGLGAAASTRVSNEMGAGNSDAAKITVFASMALIITEAVLVSGSLFAARHVFGYLFSNEKEVVDYVATMAPLVSLSVILDNIQGGLSGTARGCGWQHIGAYINLGAFYLVGIPIAAILAFWVNLRGIGLWVGIQSGAFVQTLLLSIVTSCINWEKQASLVKERMFLEDGDERQLLT